MNKKTAEALEKSIVKWEMNYNRVLSGNDPITTATDCPLCEIFNSMWSDCSFYCPVKKRTKKDACETTPYYRVDAIKNGLKGWDTIDPGTREIELLMAILEEIDFLKSLRETK